MKLIRLRSVKAKETLFVVKSIVLYVCLFLVYYNYGYYSNAKYGYQQLDITDFCLLDVLLLFVLGFFVFRKSYKKPVDFFSLLYSLVVLVPYLALHGIWGRYRLDFIFDFILLLFPVLGVVYLSKIKLPLLWLGKDNKKSDDKLLVACCLLLVASILTILFLLYQAPASASFTLHDSYIRRLDTREVYGYRTILAYLSSIVLNGCLPFFVFCGVVYRNNILVFLSLVMFVIFYYIYGFKSPLIYMFVAGVFAAYSKNNRLHVFFEMIFFLIVSLFFVAGLEFLLFDYSYVEDYFLRRVFYVGSYLVGAYFEVFNSDEVSWISGLDMQKSASMYVGEDFLGDIDLNANSNTFVYYLIQYGLLGYFGVVVLVGVVFSIFTQLSKRNSVYTYFSFIYAILILEQSATTALLSSGVGVLAIVVYLVMCTNMRELIKK